MRELAKGDHRIAENHKVRTAAHAVDGVGVARVARVEVRAGGGGQMSAGREPHDADAIGRQAVLSRLGAHGADGALRVPEFHRVVIFRPQPVLKHEGRHTE